jgi:hypothetical protein
MFLPMIANCQVAGNLLTHPDRNDYRVGAAGAARPPFTRPHFLLRKAIWEGGAAIGKIELRTTEK